MNSQDLQMKSSSEPGFKALICLKFIDLQYGR